MYSLYDPLPVLYGAIPQLFSLAVGTKQLFLLRSSETMFLF